ncbi:MAG: hypothetical protein Q9202_005427 [Teloschistes flavicans]
MTSIEEVQESRERKIDRQYRQAQDDDLTDKRHSDAARTLQRTYRGHRARRELKGLSLTPSARWSEAIKEARYRNLTTPRPSSSRTQTSDSFHKPGINRVSSDAQQQWHRAGKIARRAGGDDYSSDDNPVVSPEDREARRQARSAQKEERMKTARTMDLAYFLELVDLNHRYGSHLRKYHAEWKRRPTHENFFYWLDYGEGKEVSLPNCSREKLDSMKVRYLGREERINYAVEVDPKGKLCWKRNGVRVNTNEEWRDSIKGIVRVDDPAPSPSPGLGFYVSSSESSGSSTLGDSGSENSMKEKKKKPKPAVAAAVGKGVKDYAHETKLRFLEHRPFKKSPKEAEEKKKEKKEKKKKTLWIFVRPIFTKLLGVLPSNAYQVADTSYNLYIGIKQSGAFQHSSFLHGGRVSAAGVIKVKDGTLGYMQPRSGHYKPPAASFRAFVHSLQKRGVDMSVMSIPKSYAVLLGVEGYSKGLKTMASIRRALGIDKEGDGGSGDEEKEEARRREKMLKEKKGQGEGGQGVDGIKDESGRSMAEKAS